MFNKAKAWPLYYSQAEDYFFFLKMNPGRPSFSSIYVYIYINIHVYILCKNCHFCLVKKYIIHVKLESFFLEV